MSKQGKAPGWIKLATEWGPILVFFVAYRFAPVDAAADEAARQLSQVLFATAVFVPITLAALSYSWFATGHVPRMALVTAAVVVVFGGLTLFLRDPVFIKMKPTIIYVIMAAALGWGLMRGKSYLEVLMGANLPLQREGWMIFTRRFALFFVALAVANEVVWRGWDTDTWVTFKTFALPVATFAFVFSQAGVFQKYAIEDDSQG